MVDESDWRLQGQEEYLTGVRLTLKKWTSKNPKWDHDHCAFCWAKLSDLDIPDSQDEGYTTENDYHWICKECFLDFNEMFGWIVD
ncbi:MAG: hypothetical protein ACM3QW_07185 [Ignavibacteriales bacterium]